MTRFLGSLSGNRVEGQSLILWDEMRGRYTRADMDYHKRALHTSFDRLGWESLWPLSRSLSGDGTAGYSVGDDFFETSFSPWIEGYAGAPGGKFISGFVKDSGGNPVGGAIVQAFLTATDKYIGEYATNDAGAYCVPTPYAGQQHYLVAYRAGSPDSAGTSVNTLVPTNIDGT